MNHLMTLYNINIWSLVVIDFIGIFKLGENHLRPKHDAQQQYEGFQFNYLVWLNSKDEPPSSHLFLAHTHTHKHMWGYVISACSTARTSVLYSAVPR